MIELFDDEEFKSLDTNAQKEIAQNYFDAELADDEFKSLSREEKQSVYNTFFDQEVGIKLKEDTEVEKNIMKDAGEKFADNMDSNKAEEERKKEHDKIDLSVGIDTLKQEIAKEEYDDRISIVNDMPELTKEERILKKKAYITLEDNKDNLGFFDSMMLSTQSSAMAIAGGVLGMAKASEDMANLFRSSKDMTINEFRDNWEKKIKEINKQLGFSEDDFFRPDVAGNIAGNIAEVAGGAKLFKLATTGGYAIAEGVSAFFDELGISGNYKDAVVSGTLATTITGTIGRYIEGRPLDDITKKALDESNTEELVNISGIYEFAKQNDIEIVDAMLANNPNMVANRLKSFNAPDAMVQYAESLQSDTGKKLLTAFNKVFTDVKPDDIDNISLKNIAETMQSESQKLNSEMYQVKKKAYEAMESSPLKNKEISTKGILNSGMKVFEKYRADTSMVNAFKRSVLKNATNLDVDSSAVANRIKTVEARIARNENRLAGLEVSGIETGTLEDSIIKDMAELDELIEQVDIDSINNLTLENVVGIMQDMNELKYSGNAHVATKGAKEQAIFNSINTTLSKEIDIVDSDFGVIAKKASDSARDMFSVFGKVGRGTKDFPELELIRLSKNPDDIAKRIFSGGASDSGYKIEQSLEILGKRNPTLQKQVMGRYIDDAIGGLKKYATGKDTIKRSVLDLDDSIKAINNLIGSPDSKRLTTKILGEDNVKTLTTIKNFIRQHGENLKAMKTPTEKKEAGILSAPVIKQIIGLAQYSSYKIGNTGILRDEFHSKRYQKQINRYITDKITMFNESAKTKADWNKLGYALSGSIIEKNITSSSED